MNRIQPAAATRAKDQPSATPSDIAAGRFLSSTPARAFALFAPLHYEPNYGYPLLVWLHGPRDDERQLSRIMPLVSLRNHVAVAPRAPELDGAAPNDSQVWGDGPTAQDMVEQRILEAVAAATENYHIRPDRVFLAGFDRGGTMALRVALANPESFAGAISLCGMLPRGERPLAQWSSARRLPVLIATGRGSASYTPELVCDDLRLLHAAGMEVTLRDYACGQELDGAMLADVDRWIIERITATP